MLLPNKTKHRKVFKGRVRGRATRGNQIAYGHFALQAQGHERITSRQIESARQAMTRYIKRGGKIWIRIFPHTPVTKKPQDVKMGKGKGNPEFFVAKVKPGTIMFEMEGVREVQAREAMRLAAHKLPVKTKFIIKEGLTDDMKQASIQEAAKAGPLQVEDPDADKDVSSVVVEGEEQAEGKEA